MLVTDRSHHTHAEHTVQHSPINSPHADLHLLHNAAQEQTLTHASGTAAERCGQRGLVCRKLRPARTDHGVQSGHMASHLGP